MSNQNEPSKLRRRAWKIAEKQLAKLLRMRDNLPSRKPARSDITMYEFCDLYRFYEFILSDTSDGRMVYKYDKVVESRSSDFWEMIPESLMDIIEKMREED